MARNSGPKKLPFHRATVAKIVFCFGFILGILGIGIGVIGGSAYAPGNTWSAFWRAYPPIVLLWTLFCYGAYKGLTSGKLPLKCIFWSYVVLYAFIFPVGTAISGACIWLWRDIKKQSLRTAAPEL